MRPRVLGSDDKRQEIGREDSAENNHRLVKLRRLMTGATIPLSQAGDSDMGAVIQGRSLTFQGAVTPKVCGCHTALQTPLFWEASKRERTTM